MEISEAASSDEAFTTRLVVSDEEMASIDDAIRVMLETGIARGVYAEKFWLSSIFEDDILRKKTDDLLAETLTSLKRSVPGDTGEKLFERLAEIVDGWPTLSEQATLGVIFFRFIDTMRYMVAFRQKFRSAAMPSSISKAEAIVELSLRGLGKRS